VNALVLDFETYWSKNYTLKKLSMVEFITDDRFELTGLSCCDVESGLLNFLEPCEAGPYLRTMEPHLDNYTIVAQNANFDCLILREHFGIMPKYIVDTQDLDKMWDARSKHNLKVMAEKWGAPAAKGDTVQSLGLHWNDMTEEQRSAWAEYAKTDAEIEAWLFKKMLPIVVSRPEIELPVANMTHQMYLNPTFQIDVELGQKIIDGMRAEMLAPIDRLRRRGVKPAAGKKTLEESIGGSISFVTMLMEALPDGESVPLKAGEPTKNMIPLTGVGMIPALAKDDQGMHELLQHSKMSVRRLAEAKQSLQSWPLHISKVDSIMKQAACCDGFIGTPLGYHNAHTGRWGGIEGINLQNLGGAGRGGKGTHPLIKEVRHMLVAPKGYVLGIQDYSKVEAVGVAWQAGQRDLLEGFRTGSDVYSDLATDLFGHEVRKSKEDDAPDVALQMDIERGFGKDAILGCLARNTPILTSNGWKPIQSVSAEDKLWDGCEWVGHNGIVYRGKKACIQVSGAWLTPEHEVLTSDGWTTAAELSTHSHMSERPMVPLRLQRLVADPVGELSPSNVVAPVVEFLLRQETIWSQENLHAVMSVLKRHPGKLRVMTLKSKSRIAHDCLTEFVQSLAGVSEDRTNIMVNEVSECGPVGSQIESLFLSTWHHYLDGMTRNLRSIESAMIGDMSRVIYDSPPGRSRCVTPELTMSVASEQKLCVNGVATHSNAEKEINDTVASIVPVMLHTYDIMLAGPRRRFQASSMIVSNCGYGMGASTFYDRCYANELLKPRFDDGTFDVRFIEQVIQTYRHKYSRIPAYWKRLENEWRWVTKYPFETRRIPECGLEFFNKDGATFIRLPSGRTLRYPNAQANRSSGELRYHWGHLWGGVLTENVISALCRDFIAESLLRLQDNGFWCVLTVHDEIVAFLPEKNAESRLKEMGELMEIVPSWAKGFPLQVEGKISERYCK
jgi:hypothetical protein